MPTLREIIASISEYLDKNSNLVLRWVVFLTFFGHGIAFLVPGEFWLGAYNIVSAINFTGIENSTILLYIGIHDLLIASLVLSGILKRAIPLYATIYLILVGFAGYYTFFVAEGSYPKGTLLGFGEIFKRLSWASFSLFLFCQNSGFGKKYNLVRLGLSFTFIGHGLASLGFGFSKIHVDLARILLREEFLAKKFVFFSGFSDLTIGILLLFGLGVISRLASLFSLIWIPAVDVSSFITEFSQGVFRLGWVLAAIYVLFVGECHKRFIYRKHI